MDKNEVYVNAIIASAHRDIKQGISKDVILNSLSRIIDQDLFCEVRKRL